MPYVVFLAAAPVEIMRNMHEQARQKYKTAKMKTVSAFGLLILIFYAVFSI